MRKSVPLSAEAYRAQFPGRQRTKTDFLMFSHQYDVHLYRLPTFLRDFDAQIFGPLIKMSSLLRHLYQEDYRFLAERLVTPAQKQSSIWRGSETPPRQQVGH
jgi:hypothetical protein